MSKAVSPQSERPRKAVVGRESPDLGLGPLHGGASTSPTFWSPSKPISLSLQKKERIIPMLNLKGERACMAETHLSISQLLCNFSKAPKRYTWLLQIRQLRAAHDFLEQGLFQSLCLNLASPLPHLTLFVFSLLSSIYTFFQASSFSRFHFSPSPLSHLFLL